MNGIPVKPTSRQAIWTLVKGFRRFLGVERHLFFDIVRLVERIMPELFPEFVLEICTQKEMGKLHGETIPRENKIRIREDVYIGACNGTGRDRLTIAHEVGHFFMHDEYSISFCKLDPSGKIPIFCDSDWQADVFGGELLAPSYLIDGMQAPEICKVCAVSLPCAKKQLAVLESEKGKAFKRFSI